MTKRYSIAEARHDLAAIVYELEQDDHIELTRRGKPVAVLLSLQAYQRLKAPEHDFWTAYCAFREHFALDTVDVHELLHDLRDPSEGPGPAL